MSIVDGWEACQSGCPADKAKMTVESGIAAVKMKVEIKGKLVLVGEHQVQVWCLVTNKLISSHSDDYIINSAVLVKGSWVALAGANGFSGAELPDL